MVPQPVLALLVLFPVTASYEAHRREQAAQLESDERAQALARSMLYFKQTVGCDGAQSYVSDLAATPADPSACCMPSPTAASRSPRTARSRSSSSRPSRCHRPSAASCSSRTSRSRRRTRRRRRAVRRRRRTPARGSTCISPRSCPPTCVRCHDIAPPLTAQGHLIELDGRKTAPIDHGAIGSRPDDFLAKAADVVRSSFFAHGSEANMHQFSLIALSGVQAASA